MSVVSSVLSTRSTGWRINVRFSSLMDNVFAIGFGLGLRFVVDAVSHHDFKLTGTLVGLWEGVIMLHFLKKMPKSSDPYIAYGVRLFIDFLFTESLARTVLVLIWTALGMVLADITPAIWDDVGLKRIWKSFRRDLYTISRMIPTVAFFPPARTVRFSPSREPSVIVEPTEALSPSEFTNQETPISNIEQPFVPVSRDASKRRLPGYFHDFSDTDTDAGSIRIDQYTASGRTSRRLSVYPERRDSDDSTSELSLAQDELDLSSFPSDATETGEPQSALPDASEIPEMQLDEEPLLVDTTALPVKPEDGEVTPTQRHPVFMPPTPSDSAPHWGRRRDIDEPLPVRPPSELLPQIPDFLEEPTTEDWDKIQPEDYEKPPTPPAKDKPVGFKIPKVPEIPPPEPPIAEQSHPEPKEEEGWDTLDSQILSRPPLEGNATAEQPIDVDTTKRQTLPPSYDDVNFDDIYDDPPRGDAAHDILTGNLIDNDTDIPPAHLQPATATGPLPPLSLDVKLLNPWDQGTSDPQNEVNDVNQAEAAARAAEIEAEVAKLLEEQERAVEAERARQEEEEAEKRKQEEKERQKAKKAAEKAEMAKKEMEDDIARKKRMAEAEGAEKQKAELKKKDAEDARMRREAAKKAKEDAEKKRKEEAAEKKRKEEEAEKKRKEEERKRKEEEEKKKIEEEAEKQRKEEESERQRKEEEADKQRKEEAEKQKKEEEAEKQRKAEEEEKLRKEQEKLEEEQRSREQEEQGSREEATKVKENEEEAKHEAEAQNAQEVDEKTTNANADISEGNPEPAQNDATVTQEQTQEQLLTPTMTPRNLDGPQQPQFDTQEPPSMVPIPDAVEEQSVISDFQPLEVELRLQRMLLLRAQMVDTQSKIEEMKSAGSDFSVLEKVLRKMERQAQRRYAAGIEQAEYLKSTDGRDSINLETLNAQRSRQKVAEKIEQLLTPKSNDLNLTVSFNKKNQKTQKPEVAGLWKEYNLLNFTIDAGKTTIIDVPAKSFAEWVIGYRIRTTQPREDDEDEEKPTLWQ